MSLSYVPSIRFDESFTLNWVGATPDILSPTTRSFIYKMTEPITGVNQICEPTINIEGNASQYKVLFRIKNSVDNHWTNTMTLDVFSGGTCLHMDSCYTFEIEFQVLFVIDQNTKSTDVAYIKSISIGGERDLTIEDEIVSLGAGKTEAILQPKDIYKIFDLSDFFIKYRGDLDSASILYRFTQNNGRSWTEWEPLTTENISTIRLDEMRFAEVQYYIKLDNITSTLTIYDIMLIGDFQNVSADYLKTNRYGLKQDCVTNYLNNPNNSSVVGAGSGAAQYNSLSCYLDGTSEITNMQQTQDKSNLWSPYDFSKITAFGNLLAGQISDMLGWPVDYYLSEADTNGQDPILNEYQLKNIVDKQRIKIIVPDNKFPSESMIVGQFDLNFLNDQFEVHIVKDQFKEAFGITKRPAIDDIVYMCVLNELFYVRHAQAYRDIMNSSLYYKVVLEKYNKRPDIQFKLAEAVDAINILTDNTTMDEIFGIEQTAEKEKIANKIQMKPKSFEFTRDQINKNVIIDQIKLFNGNNDFAGGYYDFKNVIGKVAIDYKVVDRELIEGQNRSFTVWFNFNNKYDEDKAVTKSIINSYDVASTAYSLLDNYNNSGKTGYRMWAEKNYGAFMLNQDLFTLPYSFMTNIWYALVIIVNQRQRLVTMSLYKRNSAVKVVMFNAASYAKVEVDITDTTGMTYYTSMGYVPIANIEDMTNQDDFELLTTKSYIMVPRAFSHDQLMKIVGSDIKYTNLRIFNEVIPSAEIKNILDQYIIINEDALILGDDAHKKLFTTNFPNKNWL